MANGEIKEYTVCIKLDFYNQTLFFCQYKTLQNAVFFLPVSFLSNRKTTFNTRNKPKNKKYTIFSLENKVKKFWVILELLNIKNPFYILSILPQ